MKNLTKEEALSLINQYDFYTQYIDNGRQRRDAEERNRDIITILRINGYIYNLETKEIEEIEPKEYSSYEVSGHIFNSRKGAEEYLENHKKYLESRVQNPNDSFSKADMNSILSRMDIKKLVLVYNKDTNSLEEVEV